jgi:hypothetical protein
MGGHCRGTRSGTVWGRCVGWCAAGMLGVNIPEGTDPALLQYGISGGYS